jgi:general stress protein 26
MGLTGFPDMTLVGGTIKNSTNVIPLKKNQDTAIAIWSGKKFTDPYVEIWTKETIHEEVQTKKKNGNPRFAQYFTTVENPYFVVLVLTAYDILYHGPSMSRMKVWKR